ncbi:DDE-type integrase/transposase/recombinase [Azospirillum brasilense]|uniref:DDE-type integrase/transposase/recombinase n=1 Tax=Azospirillum brasilense TaxID=192 RepID=UPI003857CB63
MLWRLRLKLDLRDLAEILLLRGLVFSHEAVREWEANIAPLLTDALRQSRRRSPPTGTPPIPRPSRRCSGDAIGHRTSKFHNERLEQDHRGVKGRTRPMRGFQQPNSAHRFRRALDEVCNVLRPATKREQHAPRPLASLGARADGTG